MATENHPHHDEHPTLSVELTVYRVRGETANYWRVVAVKRTEITETRIVREYPSTSPFEIQDVLREVLLR